MGTHVLTNSALPTGFDHFAPFDSDDSHLYQQFMSKNIDFEPRNDSVNYTDMLREDLDDVLQSQQPDQTKPFTYYSVDTYSQQPTFSIPAATGGSYDMSPSTFVPRTLSPHIPTTSAELSSGFLAIPQFPGQFGDYAHGSMGSPATSAGGLDAVPSASHSSIHSSASSLRGSPYDAPQEYHGDIANPMQWVEDSTFVDPTLIEPQSATSYVHRVSASRSESPASPNIRRRNTGKSSISPARRHATLHSPYPTHSMASPKRNSLNLGMLPQELVPSPASSPSGFGEYDDNSMILSGNYMSASGSTGSAIGGKGGKDSLCPVCGKKFRDLRAHQLTHQLERPEKCPIATCEYSKKGFSRKYDCQRHTLTHYKGTMVCGFCPGSGSAAEKSFNRADVFKRHLTSVHGVEQTPPNSKKKGSSTTSTSTSPRLNAAALEGFSSTNGRCSTCGQNFANAQQFYEHLDECVYSKVVQAEPAAAFNEMHLESIKDEEIAADLYDDKGRRSRSDAEDGDDNVSDDEEMDEQLEGDSEDPNWAGRKTGASRSGSGGGSGANKWQRARDGKSGRIGRMGSINKAARFKQRGTRGKKRKNFPASWAQPAEKMTLKRRLVRVYDGPNLLLSDHMSMHSDMEIKASLGAETYVGDLDFWAMQKAQDANAVVPE